jgi:hypothetical protein
MEGYIFLRIYLFNMQKLQAVTYHGVSLSGDHASNQTSGQESSDSMVDDAKRSFVSPF